jgi:hypothetical protein
MPEQPVMAAGAKGWALTVTQLLQAVVCHKLPQHCSKHKGVHVFQVQEHKPQHTYNGIFGGY